jgi:hypothetical protein
MAISRGMPMRASSFSSNTPMSTRSPPSAE